MDAAPVSPTAGEEAEARFRAGASCSQAVFATFARRFGIDDALAMRLAAGLGGGVGRLREVCGTVTGAALVLGLHHGNDKAATYAAVQAFAARFKAEYGSVVCRDLLAGKPASEPGGAPSARTPVYYAKRPCAEMVRFAADLLAELLA